MRLLELKESCVESCVERHVERFEEIRVRKGNERGHHAGFCEVKIFIIRPAMEDEGQTRFQNVWVYDSHSIHEEPIYPFF